MICGILELENSHFVNYSICNTRSTGFLDAYGVHTYPDQVVFFGRDIPVSNLFYKYKAIRYSENTLYEYLFLTKEKLRLPSVLNGSGAPVEIFPLFIKAYRLGSRKADMYYCIQGMNRTYSILGLPNTVSINWLVTVLCSKVFNLPIEMLKDVALNYNLQKIQFDDLAMLYSQLLNNDPFVLNDWLTVFEDATELTPDPEHIMKYYGTQTSELDRFSQLFSHFTVSSQFQPHIAYDYRWNCYNEILLPDELRTKTVCSEYDQFVDDMDGDVETFNASPLEEFVIESAISFATDFSMVSSYNKFGQPTATNRWLGTKHNLKSWIFTRSSDLLGASLFTMDPYYDVEITKTYLEEVWCKNLPTNTMVCVDLVWWLLACATVINVENIAPFLQKNQG